MYPFRTLAWTRINTERDNRIERFSLCLGRYASELFLDLGICRAWTIKYGTTFPRWRQFQSKFFRRWSFYRRLQALVLSLILLLCVVAFWWGGYNSVILYVTNEGYVSWLRFSPRSYIFSGACALETLWIVTSIIVVSVLLSTTNFVVREKGTAPGIALTQLVIIN